MSPIQQMLLGVGSAASEGDAVWFTGAATNSTAAANSGLTYRANPSTTETAWTVPAGVSKISIAVMGAGAGGHHGFSTTGSYAGGGGELRYNNNVSVTAGETLYVHCGPNYDSGGTSEDTGVTNGSSAQTVASRDSWVRRYSGGSSTVLAYACGGATGDNASNGGSNGNTRAGFTQSGGGNGGDGKGKGTSPAGSFLSNAQGPGGAGGWSGAGGDGGYTSDASGADGADGAGGGGGGGASLGGYEFGQNNKGGDTYMWGAGNNGEGGEYSDTSDYPGHDGSLTSTGATIPSGLGKGGGAGRDGSAENDTMDGADGWVRIVWPGDNRQYPSTSVTYP